MDSDSVCLHREEIAGNLLCLHYLVREDFIKNFQKKSGIFTTWGAGGGQGREKNVPNVAKSFNN